jgi:hypothetical protein
VTCVNVTEAREAIQKDPKLRAAVLWGPDRPLKEAPTTQVELFTTVKAATEAMNVRKSTQEDVVGDKKAWGSLKLGVFVFESGMNLVLDKKPRKVSK